MSLPIKWIGAIFLFFGCSFVGFSIEQRYIADTRLLQQISTIVRSITQELQYRQQPLPQLLLSAKRQASGIIAEILEKFLVQLQNEVVSNVSASMESVLSAYKNIPKYTAISLQDLADHLGQYDLHGQIRELEFVQKSCDNRKLQLENDLDIRARSYRIFGICAGAVLVIIFI